MGECVLGSPQAGYDIERLLQVSGCFAFMTDEEQTLIAVLREIGDTDIDHCTIAVFEDVQDRNPDWLDMVAIYDRQSGEMGLLPDPRRWTVSDIPVAQMLLYEKEPIIISGLTRGPDVSSLGQQKLGLERLAAIAIIPLIVMGWPIGMLILGQYSPFEFSPAQIQFYQVLANLTAMALRGVHLLEAQKRHMAEQNAVHRIGQAISSVIQWDALLQVVYDQINTVIRAPNLFIATYDEFQNQVSFPFAVEQSERVSFPPMPAQQGLTGYILRTRQPLLLSNRVRERMDKMGIQAIGKPASSWMGAPIIIGDKIIGVMGIQDHDHENAYTQADLRLLAALANQVAVAMENARLYEDAHRQAIYLKLNAEVGRRIILILDIDELLSQVVDLIRHSFGYYHVNIALLDEDNGHIVSRAGSGEQGVQCAEIPQLQVGQESITNWVVEHGKPLLVNDVHQEPLYLHVDALPNTRAELAVPIKFGSRVIGVLDVESDQPYAFRPEDVTIMYALADQVAVAVQNARLFSEQQRRIRELDVLVGIGQDLCNVTSRAQLLERVRDHVTRLMDTSDFFVALYTPQDATIRLELVYDHGVRLEPFTLHYDAQEGLTSWVIETQKPLLIRDWKQDDLGLSHRVVERGETDSRSWLGVPILRHGRALGVIGVQSAASNAYDERHQTILSVVAAQLAMALGSLPSTSHRPGIGNLLT